MPTHPLDPTRIEVMDDTIAKVLQAKQPWERVAMIGQAHRTMKALIEGHLRTWHPDWPDEQIKREIRRRLLGGTT
jgi:hypothetical protein